MRTNIKLIQIFSDSNILRHYSIWLQLKRIHKNTIFYSYSYSQLSQKTGLSRNSLKKYIDFFISQGWATQKNGNLRLVSAFKLKKLYNVKLLADNKTTGLKTQDILNNLRFQLIKYKYDQFNFLKEKSYNLNNPTGKNALNKHKKAKSFFKRSGISPVLDESKFQVSFNKVGEIINMSASSAFKLFARKEKEKVLIVIKEKAKSIGKAYNKFIPYLKPNQFIFKGYIYNGACNKYVVL